MELERSRLELERSRLEIEQLKADMYGSNDDDREENQSSTPESMLMGILAPILAQKLAPNAVSAAAAAPVNSVPVTVSLSNEEIEDILDGFKKSQIKMFARLPDDTQIKLIKQQIPNADEDTISRALGAIKRR